MKPLETWEVLWMQLAPVQNPVLAVSNSQQYV